MWRGKKVSFSAKYLDPRSTSSRVTVSLYQSCEIAWLSKSFKSSKAGPRTSREETFAFEGLDDPGSRTQRHPGCQEGTRWEGCKVLTLSRALGGRGDGRPSHKQPFLGLPPRGKRSKIVWGLASRGCRVATGVSASSPRRLQSRGGTLNRIALQSGTITIEIVNRINPTRSHLRNPK